MPSHTPVQRKPRSCLMMLHFVSALGWSKWPPRHSETLPALCIMSDNQQNCQHQAIRNPESDSHSVLTQQTDHFTYEALEKHKPFHLKGRIAFWNWNLWGLYSAAMRIKLWLLSKSWCSQILMWVQELKLKEKNQKFVLLIHINMRGARSVPVYPKQT